MKTITLLFLIFSLVLSMNIQANQNNQIPFKIHNLKSQKNGQSINSDVQGVITRLINDANKLYSSNFQSHSIYLSTNLGKFYPGLWSVIISMTDDQADNCGIVMKNQNSTWWAIWVGQNPIYPSWTYYLSKLPLYSSYQFKQLFNFDNQSTTSGPGIYSSQKELITQLISNTTQGTLFQKANIISALTKNIITNTCDWNTFIVRKVKNGIMYAGYVAESYGRFIYGRQEIQTEKGSYFYYMMTCV